MSQNEVIPRISLKNVSKSFGGIAALKDISFDIMPGEIHALVGENGAGKSTLAKIITGLESVDDGNVFLDGAATKFHNPMEARANGVLAVYQDPKLFPNLDIAENIFMGIHPRLKTGFIDRKMMYLQTKKVLEWLGSDLDPKEMVASLSIGQMQFVEFARAMFDGNEKFLILDEPTASLSPNESDKLFDIVLRLKERGVSILFISHRLEELFGFVDRITILRDGMHVITENIENIDRKSIIQYMVGRPLASLGNGLEDRKKMELAAPKEKAEPVLCVENLSSGGEFYNISFDVWPGEIVGMAGLVGSGRTEIAKSIFGALPVSGGNVKINGKSINITNPGKMINQGVVYIPEDREIEGLIAQMSVIDNMALPSVKKYAKAGFVNTGKAAEIYTNYTGQFQIKSAGSGTKVSSLSGGNRQKVVLSKWMPLSPKIFIFDEPTHGIDVGTKVQVHNLIRELAEKGLGILMISSDLPEILEMSDRVLVISDGRLVAEYCRAEATQEKIMASAIICKKEPRAL